MKRKIKVFNPQGTVVEDVSNSVLGIHVGGTRGGWFIHETKTNRVSRLGLAGFPLVFTKISYLDWMERQVDDMISGSKDSVTAVAKGGFHLAFCLPG